MGQDDWACAQHILNTWPSVSVDFPARGTCRRLRDALKGLACGDAGWRDVAALVRQALLEHQARHGASTPLMVPVDQRLPSTEQWRSVGCHAISAGDRLSVTATAWRPPHSSSESADQVAADMSTVYAGDPLPRTPCAADPFWTDALGHQAYLSVGQRQAARTVVLAPPGSTTIVSMPTGNGKTDVALAAALATSRDRGVSVVVVPTVVLALDMERRLHEMLDRLGEVHSPSQHYAYTGGLEVQIKEAMRLAIQAGRQRVVFTSPEALTSGLGPAVREAAESGLLRYLVIDEAHLVEQWGTEFRPEFQSIASQIEEWRALAPSRQAVRVVAMSATLSDRQVNTLVDLFSAGGPTEVVWSSETRPELSYYVHCCASEADRTARVVEAVTMLPRPLVLYVTERTDAMEWAERLRSLGILRVTAVTGASSDAERRRSVELWRGARTGGEPVMTGVDVVVGTSAFGLGVDMADVRSVVHACQPETLDRYYQEVGRAGRDGRPAVALIATTPQDAHTAELVNRQTVITAETGWGRWLTMRHDGSEVAPGTFEVSLDARPPNVSDESRQNRQWNVRTLNLAMRAGLVRTRSPRPPSRLSGESLADWHDRVENFLAKVGSRMWVEIVHGEANRREHWARVVAAKRSDVLTEQRRALTAMTEVLGRHRCVNEIVADYYRVAWRGGQLRTAVTCRGCPACRAQRSHVRHSSRVGNSFPAVPSWTSVMGADPLAMLRQPASWLSLWWDQASTRDDLLPDLLEKLARRGIAVVGGPGAAPDLVRRLQRDAAPHPIIVDHDRDLLINYRGPMIWIANDSVTLEHEVQARLESDDVTYLVHQNTLPAPERAGVRLVDVCPAPVSLRTALGVL